MRKILLITIALFLTGCFGMNYSDGYRVGVVRKFSKRGFVSKTWEGEMLLNFTKDQNGAIVPDIWTFSIHTDNPNGDEIAQKIEEAMESGTRTKLYYKEKLYAWSFKGSTGYDIIKVEILD